MCISVAVRCCVHRRPSPQKTAPVACSTAERIEADLALSRRLLSTLDSQKGLASNPLVPKEEAANGEPGESILSHRIMSTSTHACMNLNELMCCFESPR